MVDSWLSVSGVVKQGHRVASGDAEDSPYPRGTIELQIVHFQERGLDLSSFFHGTINVSIFPHTFKIVNPEFTFYNVQWTDKHPPENFSFSRCRILFDEVTYDGWVYYPHPETKKMHFQHQSIIEIIAPYIPTLDYDDTIRLLINPGEIEINRKIEVHFDGQS